MKAHYASDPLFLLDPRECEVVAQVARWAREFLCRENPDLGRNGVVCPYMEASLDRYHHCQFAVIQGAKLTEEDVARHVAGYRGWFTTLGPTDGKLAQFKAIVIVFPDLTHESAPVLIDAVQARLKTSFVESGLMLGEFHPGSEKPGLWNEEFRPLKAPLPMLAIRHIVPSDWPFLKDDPQWIKAYVKATGDAIPPRLVNEVQAAVAALENGGQNQE